MSEKNHLEPSPRSLYKQALPKTCISLVSAEGKNLLKESLSLGHMECYFRISVNFKVQAEERFCSIASLLTVLDAFDIDPMRTWRSNWRLLDQYMLNCCVPIEVIKDKGMNFDQFFCMASCHPIHVAALRPRDVTLESFRKVVSDSTQREDAYLVLSYDRGVLRQTGTGHFSPIGGYHPEKDLVLIFDVCSFKHLPYWVSLPLLYEAMEMMDSVTGRSRGFFVLSKQEEYGYHRLFRLADAMNLTTPELFDPGVSKFISTWQRFINRKRESCVSLDTLAATAAKDMTLALSKVTARVRILTTHVMFSCRHVGYVTEKTWPKFMDSLEQTTTYFEVSRVLKSLTRKRLHKLQRLFGVSPVGCHDDCRILVYSRLKCNHFIALLILCWPYDADQKQVQSLAVQYDQTLKHDLPAKCDILKTEIETLRQQFKLLLN